MLEIVEAWRRQTWTLRFAYNFPFIQFFRSLIPRVVQVFCPGFFRRWKPGYNRRDGRGFFNFMEVCIFGTFLLSGPFRLSHFLKRVLVIEKSRVRPNWVVPRTEGPKDDDKTYSIRPNRTPFNNQNAFQKWPNLNGPLKRKVPFSPC